MSMYFSPPHNKLKGNVENEERKSEFMSVVGWRGVKKCLGGVEVCADVVE